MSLDPWLDILQNAHRLKSSAESSLHIQPVDVNFEIPPENLGDLAFPVFAYAKTMHKPPDAIAIDLASHIPRSELFASCRAAGGYVNFRLDSGALARLVTNAVNLAGEKYGQREATGTRVLLEHTSVNPTGPIHVGRARNPIIGDALGRVMRLAGHQVTTEYFVNDVGKQMVLLFWGLKNLRPSEVDQPERDKEDHVLVCFYRRAAQLAEEDVGAKEEVEELIRRFEGGDIVLTKEIRDVAARVLAGIRQSLERIGVVFDNYFWESDLILDGSAKAVVQKLSSMARESDGALYLDLSDHGLEGDAAKFFFVRRDGTTLYTTRDIAYHLRKRDRCDLAINILGEDQKLTMLRLKGVLRKMGLSWSPETIFYAFVALPEGRMSTRKGRVVNLDDLVDEAVDRAYEEVKKRRPDLDESRKREIANLVGIGALRYNIARVQAEKKMIFRWEEALNFEGNSAPFLQYAHARACGILSKAPHEIVKPDPNLLVHPNEFRLLKNLARFPGVVKDCAESRVVHPLATYAFETASLFNQFYRDCPVIAAEAPLRATRIALVEATRIVLQNSLDCLGIKAPREM